MANLLPPFARKQLVREYWMRILAVVLFMLSLVIAMSIIMFIPTYIHISTEVTAMEASIREVEAEQLRTEEASAAIQATNRLVRLLHTTEEAQPFTHYYGTLTALAGTSVTIDQFSIVREPEGVVETVQIQAVARTRQSLIDFLDALNSHTEFGRVDVPIANLAQSENIEFSVRIPVLNDNNGS